VGTYKVPVPIRQAIQRHRCPMPAALPWIAVRRPDATDQDGCEAVSLGPGRRAARPVPKSRVRLSTPRHGATEAFPRWLGKSSYPLGSEPCPATAGRGVDKWAGESVTDVRVRPARAIPCALPRAGTPPRRPRLPCDSRRYGKHFDIAAKSVPYLILLPKFGQLGNMWGASIAHRPLRPRLRFLTMVVSARK
jgi:hypothetical protein